MRLDWWRWIVNATSVWEICNWTKYLEGGRGWQFIVPLTEIGTKILPFHIYENTVLESLLWRFAVFKQEVRITHCIQQKIFPHKNKLKKKSRIYCLAIVLYLIQSWTLKRVHTIYTFKYKLSYVNNLTLRIMLSIAFSDWLVGIHQLQSLRTVLRMILQSCTYYTEVS